MPNYVYNKLVVDGGFDNLDIFTNDNFDFNKIIEMPKALVETTAGGYDSSGLYGIWCNTKKHIKNGIRPTQNVAKLRKIEEAFQSLNRFFSMDIETEAERFNRLAEEKKDQALQQGEECYTNFIQYGHCNWYTWAIENWDTKWNASDTEIIDDSTIRFTTAWSVPANVISLLSRMTQGKKVEIMWVDECEASNVGRITYLNGNEIEGGYLELGTPEWEKVCHHLGMDYLGFNEDFEGDDI